MESETARRLFDRLRQLREKCNLTQEAFAEQAGLKYKHYQAVEAGRKTDIKISTLEKLAKGLGLEPWELIHPADPVVAEAPAKYIRRGRSGKKQNRPKGPAKGTG